MSKLCYIAQSSAPDMPVKIGITRNPTVRLRQLGSGSPYKIALRALVTGGALAERQLHDRFAHLRLGGEWFRPHPDMNEALRRMFEAGAILRKVPTDRAFCREHLAPLALQYLAGRDPANTVGGDLVYRLLRNDLPDSAFRAEDLDEATKGAISVEMALGYIPAAGLGDFTHIQIPEAGGLHLAVVA